MNDPITIELTDGPQADEITIETHELGEELAGVSYDHAVTLARQNPDGREQHMLVVLDTDGYRHQFRITDLDLTTLHQITGNVLQIDGYR